MHQVSIADVVVLGLAGGLVLTCLQWTVFYAVNWRSLRGARRAGRVPESGVYLQSLTSSAHPEAWPSSREYWRLVSLEIPAWARLFGLWVIACGLLTLLSELPPSPP